MIHQDILISVVIPVYNRSHLISRTLESVVNQTYQRIEVIIVDDCSKDSPELVAELKKFNSLDIKYIRHEENKHGGAARNTGIDAALGDYIAFLDSDDIWKPNKIEDCLRAIKEKDVDFVFGQLHVLKDNKKLPTRGLFDGERLSDYILLNGGTIQTSTIFIKSDVAKEVRFDDELTRFQDYDFVVSLEKYNASCIFIDDCHAVMYDDDIGNRISNSYDPRPAELWASKIESNVSSEALSVFYMKRVLRYTKMSGQSVRALKILFSSRVSNASIRERLYWFVICCTPLNVINVLKKFKF